MSISASSTETMADGTVRITTADLVITVTRKNLAAAAELATAVHLLPTKTTEAEVAEPKSDDLRDSDESEAGATAIECLKLRQSKRLRNLAARARTCAHLPGLVEAFEPLYEDQPSAVVFCVALERVFRLSSFTSGPAIRLLMASMGSFLTVDTWDTMHRILNIIQLFTDDANRLMISMFIDNGVVETMMRTILYRSDIYFKINVCRTMTKLAAHASGSQRQALGRAQGVFVMLKEQGKVDNPVLLHAATAALDELL